MPLFLGHESSDETHAKLLSCIPLGRVCQPNDVANTVPFLASDEATYFTGVCLGVDGGRGILPSPCAHTGALLPQQESHHACVGS